jgi:hypothetical protein
LTFFSGIFNKRVPLALENLDLFAAVVAVIASCRFDFAIQKIGKYLMEL